MCYQEKLAALRLAENELDLASFAYNARKDEAAYQRYLAALSAYEKAVEAIN